MVSFPSLRNFATLFSHGTRGKLIISERIRAIFNFGWLVIRTQIVPNISFIHGFNEDMKCSDITMNDVLTEDAGIFTSANRATKKAVSCCCLGG